MNLYLLKRKLFSIVPVAKLAKSTLAAARKDFKILSLEDINFFKSILGSSGVLQDASDLASYNTDWLKTHTGSSKLVLRPKTTQEVSKILEYCNARNLAVCPQGGNTGLVGGSIPIFDEIVISLSLMKKILSFDIETGVLQCEAGCVLESLETFVNERNFTVPVDLGAKGSCQIGGNISTNAGGLRFIRYGSLHGNTLGLKAVLANGEVLDCMNTMRKNNTGYDLKHLFIGSEGTLGIVTEVAMLCYSKPPEKAVAFLGCNSFEQVLKAAMLIKQKLSELLSSLEMLDDQAADTVRDNVKISFPIERHAFYILIEVSGSNAQHNEQLLNDCLMDLLKQNIIDDGTMATEPSRIQPIWTIRERITESLLREGYCYKYDISLSPSDFYAIVDVMRERLGSKVTRCAAYGHLGDGNLHFTATTREFDPEVFSLIEPFIFEWTSERKGSISAEHGIGYKKTNYLHLNQTDCAIALMKSMKKVLDPNGILNPYKVLPSD